MKKKYDKWTVSEHLRNITDARTCDGGYMSASQSNKKAIQEFWLSWDGHKCHVLTGARGKIILDEFAVDLNSQRYEPRFENGKIYMDLSAGQKLKLAQDHSPLLTFPA